MGKGHQPGATVSSLPCQKGNRTDLAVLIRAAAVSLPWLIANDVTCSIPQQALQFMHNPANQTAAVQEAQSPTFENTRANIQVSGLELLCRTLNAPRWWMTEQSQCPHDVGVTSSRVVMPLLGETRHNLIAARHKYPTFVRVP